MVEEERDSIILNNLGLVHSIAGRFTGRGIDYDDLYQAGCIGLIKAVDHFDSSRGYQFSTYAVPVIMGEVKRLFRDDGAIKVSRSLKEKALKARALRDKFISQNSREPTVSELARVCGCNAEEISEVLNLMTPVMSLSAHFDDEEENIDIPCDTQSELFEKLCISEATKRLNSFERTLIRFRYYDDKTQSETARELGISQVQVSRREKAILQKLREYMK